MSLAAVEKKEAPATSSTPIDEAVLNWMTFPPSAIADHGSACCRVARAWLTRMDASLTSSSDAHLGPRWIRLRHAWGPSKWPIHWCEAVEEKVLDCGALAAMTLELFRARAVECYPVQFIQRYSRDAAAHWHANWHGEQACVPHWIRDELVYHEGCAVVTRDNAIRIWDPTPSWWMNSKQFDGYGCVLALRVTTGADAAHSSLQWGEHTIATNQWHKIDHARGGLWPREG